jgi:hypothetical protein
MDKICLADLCPSASIRESFVFLRKFFQVAARGVAQISNLPYRRIPFGSAPSFAGALDLVAASGLQIRDTADWEVCATSAAALPRARIRG